MTDIVRQPLLEVRGVYKRFGVVQALDGADFEVYPGEVVGFVGDNGAGKSTLIKIISGTYAADAGSYMFQGRPASVRAPRDATRLGIATIYQDLALCDNLDVVANLFLGREPTSLLPGPLGILDEITMERRANEVLSTLAVTIPSVRSKVAELSGGQRQLVAVARAVMWDAKVVILDEPTAALGVTQTHQVLDLIHSMRARGLGVVVISHNLANVFAVSDRIIVIRLGKRVATFDVPSTTDNEVVAAITGAQFGRRSPVPAATGLVA